MVPAFSFWFVPALSGEPEEIEFFLSPDWCMFVAHLILHWLTMALSSAALCCQSSALLCTSFELFAIAAAEVLTWGYRGLFCLHLDCLGGNRKTFACLTRMCH